MEMVRGAGGGGKGGGGGSRTPVESPDSLRSRQYARVLDLISEGEIEGLVDGLKSIYLDDTPIQAADGMINFPGVAATVRNGTQSQAAIPGFPASESEIAVATEVRAATPVVRSVSNTNLSAVRVTVSVPQLTFLNPSTGDLGGTSVEIAIDTNNNNGGWQERKRDTISGKTTSRYQRSYRIDLPAPGPWQIRVRRITPDSTQANLQNKTFWDSYTEIIDARLRYPNSAIVGLQVDAAQFGRIPARGYDIRGLRVKIPSNYNPTTRTYTGVWNGTFSIAWTDNPAWVFYDLLTNPRYGLGNYIDATQVDKWALYSISQYCDQLVPDGFGGMEPRFRCNLVLSSRQEAFSVLQNMASLFRSLIWWSQGAITAVQDAPVNPAALFTPANVVGGQFSYSGSSAKARHTVALVGWNDPADMYRQKVEYVEDTEGIARYGVQQIEITAVGCTSRGQAHRLGRWLLFTERMETEQVAFSAGLDAAPLWPGAVIQIQDPYRSGKRFGGRIESATASSVTLDDPVTIEAGKTYQLSVVLPSGAVESRAVTNGAGNWTTLSVSPSYSAVPAAQSVWVLAASDLVPTTWRVLSLAEGPDNTVSITALAHRPDKFAAIEQGLVLQPLPTTALRTAPSTPTDLAYSESLYLVAPGVVGVRVTLSWRGDAPKYIVRWRHTGGGNWQSIETDASSADLPVERDGPHEFAVTAVNAIGITSPAAWLAREVIGKTAPPSAISGFSVAKSAGIALASWSRHPDLDVRVGGHIVIRHAAQSANWGQGVILETFPGDATTALLPLMTGHYMARAIDSSGNWSPVVSFHATEGMVTGFTTVATSVQHPAFTGAKNGTVVIGGALYLSEVIGGVVSSGSYEFDAPLDLGSNKTRRYEVAISALAYDVHDMIDARTLPIDDWDDINGATINSCDATIYAQTSADNVTWTPWTQFFVADFGGRYARFRAELTSTNPSHNIRINQLQVTVKEAA